MRWLLIAGIALMVGAGAMNGLHETLVWKYPAFAKKFPRANQGYWDPGVSWMNKCKSGEGYNPDIKCVPKFFGATTFLAFLTDAKHLIGELYRLFIYAGVMALLFHMILHNWKYLLVKMLLACYLLHAIGFHLVYTIFF